MDNSRSHTLTVGMQNDTIIFDLTLKYVCNKLRHIYKNICIRAGEIIQWVRCLPWSRAIGLVPDTTYDPLSLQTVIPEQSLE